jgi:hypothetical protein
MMSHSDVDDPDHLLEQTLQTAELIDSLPEENPRLWANAQAYHPDTGYFYVTVPVNDAPATGQAVIVRSDGELLPYARHTSLREHFALLPSMLHRKTSEPIPPRFHLAGRARA